MSPANLTEFIDPGAINAWKLGRGAAAELMPRDSGPFMAGTLEYRSWLSGWYSWEVEN